MRVLSADIRTSAVLGHPRFVAEMLNIEREPDPDNAAAFVPDMQLERRPAVANEV